MKVRFVADIAPIGPDLAAARRLYVDALGLPLVGNDYPATFDFEGAKHFGQWPLGEAARACLGTARWPADVPRPQASVEFEVDDVAASAAELERHRCGRPRARRHHDREPAARSEEVACAR